MKFAKYILLILAISMTQVSCDEGFAELNTNPNAANEINPNFQFTWVQLRTSGGRYENWRASLIYSSMMVQHMAALCGYWTGDKYTYNSGYASSLYDRAYSEQVKDVQDLINTLEEGKAGDVTMLGMARIWRVVIFHRLTDIYGDIPYSEAGKGFLEGIDFPKYDAQQDIYNDMLKELEEAIGQLGSGGFGGADLLYGGDVDKWKRFGYSMMLRLGMRMSEADAGAAQSWVSKAIAGGVMNSSDDDAFIEHTNGPEGVNKNGIGEVLDKSNGFGDDCPRLSATLVDWMLSTGDPRLDIIGQLPESGSGVHNGLPNGLDATTILDNPTGTSTADFDRINPLLVQVESPMFFMTHAEAEFLQAEAALRGWGNGDAAAHYAAGIESAMNLYTKYDGSLAIDATAASDYLANNPLSGDMSEAMSQIGWQYWAATLLNEYESFANWRRTGHPELTPVNYEGNVTGGQIPLRLSYSQGETTNNPNFEEARSRQGLPTDYASMMT
ncbi:MAG: SusD/RagB family nutrient-binding outer membrane lipoprotein, partial [Bacteroidota bacterium]